MSVRTGRPSRCQSTIELLVDKARSLTAMCYFQLDISHQNPDFRLLLTDRSPGVFMGRSPLHREQVPTALLLSMTTPEDPVSERLCKPDGAVVQDPPSIPADPSQNRISRPVTNSSHISGHREYTCHQHSAVVSESGFSNPENSLASSKLVSKWE